MNICQNQVPYVLIQGQLYPAIRDLQVMPIVPYGCIAEEVCMSKCLQRNYEQYDKCQYRCHNKCEDKCCKKKKRCGCDKNKKCKCKNGKKK